MGLPRSPVDSLIKALEWLDSELERMKEYARRLSGELVKKGDSLASSIRGSVEASYEEAIKILKDFLAEASKEIEANYSKLAEKKVKELEEMARKRFEDAVRAVVEEIKRVVGETR
jgi:vacuolar-type H+-ATPase subunit H